MTRNALFASLGLAAALLLPQPGSAAEPAGFLSGIRHHHTLTSTVPDNGDQNPYAIVVAPVAAGTIQKDDVLVDNFNDKGNLQGLARPSSSTVPRRRSCRCSPRSRATSAAARAASGSPLR